MSTRLDKLLKENKKLKKVLQILAVSEEIKAKSKWVPSANGTSHTTNVSTAAQLALSSGLKDHGYKQYGNKYTHKHGHSIAVKPSVSSASGKSKPSQVTVRKKLGSKDHHPMDTVHKIIGKREMGQAALGKFKYRDPVKTKSKKQRVQQGHDQAAANKRAKDRTAFLRGPDPVSETGDSKSKWVPVSKGTHYLDVTDKSNLSLRDALASHGYKKTKETSRKNHALGFTSHERKYTHGDGHSIHLATTVGDNDHRRPVKNGINTIVSTQKKDGTDGNHPMDTVHKIIGKRDNPVNENADSGSKWSSNPSGIHHLVVTGNSAIDTSNGLRTHGYNLTKHKREGDKLNRMDKKVYTHKDGHKVLIQHNFKDMNADLNDKTSTIAIKKKSGSEGNHPMDTVHKIIGKRATS